MLHTLGDLFNAIEDAVAGYAASRLTLGGFIGRMSDIRRAALAAGLPFAANEAALRDLIAGTVAKARPTPGSSDLFADGWGGDGDASDGDASDDASSES